MNTDPDAAAYAARCIRDLGLQANDTERALIWAYDHPPKKPLPTPQGERHRQLWISDMVNDCLNTIVESIDGEYRAGAKDALANAVLIQFAKEYAPEIWAFHERFQTERAEIKKRIAELRRNEPDLQPQEQE